MELPLKNTQINVTNGYRLVNQSRFQTDYSYTITEKSNVASEHNLIELNGTTVYSGETPLSLIDAEIVSSEIKNWGEFTPYFALTVRSVDNEELYIRPVLTDTEVVLSARNNLTQEEIIICSYDIDESTGIPSNASFYINIGTISYSPSSQSYIAKCTVYAIIGQVVCGFDGEGYIDLLIDSYSQQFGNKTYTVTQNEERKEI